MTYRGYYFENNLWSPTKNYLRTNQSVKNKILFHTILRIYVQDAWNFLKICLVHFKRKGGKLILRNNIRFVDKTLQTDLFYRISAIYRNPCFSKCSHFLIGNIIFLFFRCIMIFIYKINELFKNHNSKAVFNVFKISVRMYIAKYWYVSGNQKLNFAYFFYMFKSFVKK